MKKISRNVSRKMKYIAAAAVVVTAGLALKFAVGGSLKAEEPKPFLEVETKTTKLKTDTVIDSGDVTFTLKSDKNRLIKVPDTGGFSLATLNEGVEEIAKAPEDFSEEAIVKAFEESDEKKDTKKDQEGKEEKEEKSKDFPSDNSLVRQEDEKDKDKKGTTYITLLADKPLTIVAHHTKATEKMPVEVMDAANEDKQVLFTFAKNKFASEVKQTEEAKGDEKESEVSGGSSFRGAEGGPAMPVPTANTHGITFGAIGIANEGIKDGSDNFDPDDAPGHDSSINNRIVRTWDTIQYPVAFSIQDKDADMPLKNFRYTIDGVYKDTVKTVNGVRYQTAEFVPTTYSKDLTAANFDSVYTSGLKVAQASGGQLSFPLNLKVFGMQNGEIVKPKITITIVDAEDSTGKRVPIGLTGEVPIPDIKVSAKPNVRAQMDTSSSTMVEYDDYAQTTGSNKNVQLFGVSLYIRPLTDPGIRRGSGDLRGSTFPKGEVSFTGSMKSRYTDNHNASLNKELTTADQPAPQITDYGLIYEKDQLRRTTKTPEYASANLRNGDRTISWVSTKVTSSKNNAIFNEGLHDSGKFTMANSGPNAFKFSFKDFQQYTDLYHGLNTVHILEDYQNRYTFASGFANVTIPYNYVLNREGTVLTELNLDTVTFNDNNGTPITVPNDKETIQFIRPHIFEGTRMTYSSIVDINTRTLGTSMTSQINPHQPSGDEVAIMGEKVKLIGSGDSESISYRASELLMSWNEDTFDYDNTRPIEYKLGTRTSVKATLEKEQFGVLKSGQSFSLNNDYDSVYNRYVWYDVKETALQFGDISAYYAKAKKNDDEFGAPLANSYILPLTVSSTKTGTKNNAGTDNVTLTAQKLLDKTGKVVDVFPLAKDAKFKPTTYNSDGTVKTIQVPNTVWGDTLLVAPIKSRISTKLEQVNVTSVDIIGWRLETNVTTNKTDDFNITWQATIPVGLKYRPNSTLVSQRKAPPLTGKDQFNLEPTIVNHADGSSTLTWTVKANHDTPVDLLTFETDIDHSKITYDGNKSARKITTAIIATKGVDKPDIKDADSVARRTDSQQVTITQLEQVMFAKSTIDPRIEVGNNDPAIVGKVDLDGKPKRLDDIHYNLTIVNGTNLPVDRPKVLDVLPFNGDGRGTTYKGTLDLLDVKVTNGIRPTIWYTKSNAISPTTDPNTINTGTNGWTQYIPGTTGEVKDVRAIYLFAAKIEPSQAISLDITVAPKGQKPGDILVNDGKLNSSINAQVGSSTSKTSVYGRNLTGLAWYDDNYDGLQDSDEDMIPNMPVQIYRTSIDNPEYENKRVTQDLYGNDITNAKTGADGKYKFENLPEGNYIVKYNVKGKYLVTDKDTEPSSTAEKTSKANTEIVSEFAATDPYEEPVLLSNMLTSTSYIVPNINIGLVREGSIDIYKYMNNLIADANGDFTPDNPSVDLEDNGDFKNTAVALADAEFELREVVIDAKTDKELSSTKVGDVQKSKANGKLTFKVLPLKDDVDETGKVTKKHIYRVVETKAPVGYELLGKQIDVTEILGNQSVKKYVPNKSATKLPFTGTNDIMQGILIVAGSMFLIGLVFVGIKLFQLDDGFHEMKH